MSNEEYIKLIIEMVSKMNNSKFIVSIYSFVKVKFEKDKKAG